MSESAGFVTIKDLAGATLATEDDDLIIQQGEETKRINLKTLGDLLVFLDKIEQVKTSTKNGGINEIKATLSDGSTATFTTQNGHGIQKIEQTVKSDVSSGTNVITATLSDGQKSNFEIKNGDQGEKGDTGAALIDVVQKETSAVSGGKNVISFKLNDGSYKDVEVYNGAKGETGEVSQEVLNQTVNEAIAGVVANAPEDFNTLKEMSDWISEHEDDATAMNSAILENKNSIAQRCSVKVGEIYHTNGYYKVVTAGYYARPIEFEVKASKGSYNKFVFGISITSKHFKFGNTANSSFRYIAPESNGTEGALLIKSSKKDVSLNIFNTSNYQMEECTLSEITEEEWNKGTDFPQSYSVEELKSSIQEQLNGIQNYSTTPQKIGTWIDGKSIYRVVIENELEGNVVGLLAGTVEAGAKIISAYGQLTDPWGQTSLLPCFHPEYNIGLFFEGNSIYFDGWSNTSFTKVMLIVEYTK